MPYPAGIPILAHALLEQFGSLSGVLEAPVSALAQVPGMGGEWSHPAPAGDRRQPVLHDPEEQRRAGPEYGGALWRLFNPRFFGLRDEAGVPCVWTPSASPLACRILGWGSVNAAGVPIRKIVEFALSVNATSVVLAHNHPSGIALPSQADIAATERLSTALDAVGIVLADHIIVSDEDFVSMAASGVYRPPQSPALPR